MTDHLCCDVSMLFGRFVEYGEFNGNLYGTTFDQVTSIVNAGHVCVLCLNPKVSRPSWFLSCGFCHDKPVDFIILKLCQYFYITGMMQTL